MSSLADLALKECKHLTLVSISFVHFVVYFCAASAQLSQLQMHAFVISGCLIGHTEQNCDLASWSVS